MFKKHKHCLHHSYYDRKDVPCFPHGEYGLKEAGLIQQVQACCHCDERIGAGWMTERFYDGNGDVIELE